MKFLLKLLISLVVIIVIFAIAIVTIINLTPRQLKINDIEVAGTSIDDLGLSDTKIIDIFKGIKDLTNAKEEDIVENGYQEEEEKNNAEANTQGSSLSGSDNYSSIVNEKVTYDNQYLKTYEDSTIAYMLDNAIKHSTGEDESIQTLQDANISIKEITINKDAKTLRVVGKIDLANFKEQIEGYLGFAKSFIKIPDSIFLVSELNITGVDEEGKLTFSSKSICINGNNEDPVSKAVSQLVMSVTGKGDINELNEELGKALANVIANLGQIGTADTNESGIVTGSIVLGENGIQNGKLTVITYKVAA